MELLKTTHADGFTGDMMLAVPQAYHTAAVAGYPAVAMEPEGGGSIQSMGWTALGCRYWDQDPYTGGAGGS